jgi:hypothetical protein
MMLKALLFASAGMLAASPAVGQHAGHGQAMPPMAMPAPVPAPAPTPAPAPQATGEAATAPVAPPQPQPMAMAGMDHGSEHHAMTGALGPYAMSREASGTSWQPDASEHRGLHGVAGDWMLMGHLLLNGVYDRQEGPRGAEKGFVSGMAMGMARRDVGGGTLQFRAMLSPEPLMGARGYPLLLASGETANGSTPLVDRQHPHDFFMELSASYSFALSDRASAFLYAGLPGEPAFGPPAFMHRLSIMDSPEAPISHHWLDSTHIAFGVVTGGLVVGDAKVEVSRFNGREPDQHRWNIETGPLDSTALRLSWNPTRDLALQASWGHFVSPEQLEPGENQTRWSASAIYTRPLAGGWWSTTLACGRRSAAQRDLDAYVLESAVRQGAWTLFGRAERTDNDELGGVHHGPVRTVGKVSLGAVRDFRLGPHLSVGLGGLAAQNFVPAGLKALYGGNGRGFMGFVRLKLD